MNNIKVRAKITCQGRTLGTKVIQSGPLSANSVKTKTVVLNTKKKGRSEEHTSELQSRLNLVCRLLLEKKKGETYEGA